VRSEEQIIDSSGLKQLKNLQNETPPEGGVFVDAFGFRSGRSGVFSPHTSPLTL
jgi:hypothetical protein